MQCHSSGSIAGDCSARGLKLTKQVCFQLLHAAAAEELEGGDVGALAVTEDIEQLLSCTWLLKLDTDALKQASAVCLNTCRGAEVGLLEFVGAPGCGSTDCDGGLGRGWEGAGGGGGECPGDPTCMSPSLPLSFSLSLPFFLSLPCDIQPGSVTQIAGRCSKNQV